MTMGSRYPLAIVIAVALNILLILGMPVLLRFSSPPKTETISNPIKLADYRRPEPPPPKKEKLEKEKPPPKVHPKIKDIMPKIDASNLSMLDVGLEFDMGLAGGMEVSMGVKIWNELDVDQKPVALFRMQPIYPVEAKSKNVTGRVEFRLLVARDGRVKDIEILESEPGDLFDQATIDAVKRWRFQPAKVKGSPVACWVKTAIDYQLQ
jgi:protein TonB